MSKGLYVFYYLGRGRRVGEVKGSDVFWVGWVGRR